MSTATVRKSTRIAKKVTISYKEKKISKPKRKQIRAAAANKKQKIDTSTTASSSSTTTTTTVISTTVQDAFKASKHTQYDLLRKFEVSKAVEHIKLHDPKLGAYLTKEVIADFKLRLENADGSNPFRSLTRSIVYQQIHGKAAASIYNKFLKLFDDTFPTPSQVLAKTVEELRSAGLSARKADSIRDLAEKFNKNLITPEYFDKMSDQEISAQLCTVKGIGQWTADMFLMFNLHHPDVLPVGDLAIRKGIAKHFGLTIPSDAKKNKMFPTLEQMEELTHIWRPYRSLCSWLLWRISDISTV